MESLSTPFKKAKTTVVAERIDILAEFLNNVDLAKLIDSYLGQCMYYAQINPSRKLLHPLEKENDTPFGINLYDEDLKFVQQIRGVVPKRLYRLMHQIKNYKEVPLMFNASVHSNVVVVAVVRHW